MENRPVIDLGVAERTRSTMLLPLTPIAALLVAALQQPASA
jgi:hypothetical protein